MGQLQREELGITASTRESTLPLGLKDVVNNTHDHKYLIRMKEPDVLIFTMKMTDNNN